MDILRIHRANAIAFLEDVEDEDYRELLKEEIKQLTKVWCFYIALINFAKRPITRNVIFFWIVYNFCRCTSKDENNNTDINIRFHSVNFNSS